jgi:hypothetical protein
MKKILFALSLLIIGAVAFAQTPDKVQSTFKAKYPDVMSPTWSTDDDNYVATYTDKSGMHNVVVFDKDSRIVRTESEVDSRDYPSGIKEYYTKKYPDEKDYHVYSITDEDGSVSYYVTSEKHGVRYYFNKTGNFLREEKDKMKDEMKEHTDHDK